MLKGFGLTPKSVHNGTFSYSQICPLFVMLNKSIFFNKQ